LRISIHLLVHRLGSTAGFGVRRLAAAFLSLGAIVWASPPLESTTYNSQI
jgi:hypothetical protein